MQYGEFTLNISDSLMINLNISFDKKIIKYR